MANNRASYTINSEKLNIGPTNITSDDPISGEFKLQRGMSVIFPGVYFNDAGNTIVRNRRENWTWDLIIEDEATYDILLDTQYSGQISTFTTAYGTTINSPVTYSGKVVELNLEMIDGAVFRGNKRGYKANMIVSVE
ncbi:MAG TPA: hypothetical protein PKL04_00365 [Methanofastidiosum sp.]|nr:hypothetical protein [Methanofastidiosum sp.]